MTVFDYVCGTDVKIKLVFVLHGPANQQVSPVVTTGAGDF